MVAVAGDAGGGDGHPNGCCSRLAILATDLASYFDKRAKFLSIADAGEIDWQVQY
jgi:hypothetical protein